MDYVNYNITEQQIENIGKEVADKKQSPEHKDLSDKELIKQVITPLINPIKTAGNQTASINKDDDNLPDYMKDASQDTKQRVEFLIDMALKKGIGKAASEAQKSGPYFLDAFHDALTDKLYEELKSRKII